MRHDTTDQWIASLKARALPPVEHGSDAWHERRRAGIGGSDAPIIQGLSHWVTRQELLAIKRGEVIRRAPDARGEALMGVGTLMEAAILAAHAPSAAPGDALGQIADIEQPYMLAHIDGIYLDQPAQAIVEVKTSGRPWPLVDGEIIVPPAYRAQVQHYMAVTGARRCVVIHWHTLHDRMSLHAHLRAGTLTPDEALRLGDVQRAIVRRDLVAQEIWRHDAARFWQEVQGG